MDEEVIFEGDTETRMVSALLTSKDMTEAAKRAGVSRTTLYKYLKRPDFLERLERERVEIHAMVRATITEELAQGAYEAVEALRGLCAGGLFIDYPSQIKAAEKLLEVAGGYGLIVPKE